jgi:hypothetical protein
MPISQTTRLNRPWLAKMAIFAIVLIGFGVYGLYDATVAYPNRGKAYAGYAHYDYLRLASQRGPLGREVSIADPRAELARLRAQPNRSPEETAKKQWLEALAVVGQLDPQHTTTTNPEETYAALRQQWTSSAGAKAQPKPLAWYDIPVQWVFVGLGFGGGTWLLLLWFMVARQKYGWDPEARTLQLPGGQTIAPADLEDVDKRKWDKFLVFLKLKPPHPLSGRELKLDLYRHTPLESWVLEMEKQAFPDRIEKDPPPAPEEPLPAGA